jgi:signal transduction histidine kinase
MIKRQVRRMTQLVDELLDVSRITHGRLHLQRERIDLRVILGNAIQTLESDIKQRKHRLTTVLPDAPVWLQSDPGRLEQVFVNLLANASKYTDKGGELAVSVGMRDGQAIDWSMAVPSRPRLRDRGSGPTRIAADVRDRTPKDGARGLEWELPSPPPHHSWETPPSEAVIARASSH